MDSTISRPKIVTLCGSIRFKEYHEKAQRELTLKGIIVIPMGLYGHLTGMDMDGPVKKMLDELHFRKIDISDGIYVVNPVTACCPECRKPAIHMTSEYWRCENRCRMYPDVNINGLFTQDDVLYIPYIGESTANEIAYAEKLGKEIEYLSPMK